jgi:hypothetical protein
MRYHTTKVIVHPHLNGQAAVIERALGEGIQCHL